MKHEDPAPTRGDEITRSSLLAPRSLSHEARHAIGLWVVALVLGGFAVAVWAARVGGGEPEPEPGVEVVRAGSGYAGAAISARARRT